MRRTTPWTNLCGGSWTCMDVLSRSRQRFALVSYYCSTLYVYSDIFSFPTVFMFNPDGERTLKEMGVIQDARPQARPQAVGTQSFFTRLLGIGSSTNSQDGATKTVSTSFGKCSISATAQTIIFRCLATSIVGRRKKPRKQSITAAANTR